MFNSIIIAHRNRLPGIRVLLRSLYLASKQVKPDSYEVVITDLASDPSCLKEFKFYKENTKLNLKVFDIPYNGIFWKTKALNHCAKNVSGKYITMLDADSCVNPNFLKEIERFYSKNNPKTKLAHRVRFLTPHVSNSIIRKARALTTSDFDHMIFKKYRDFPIARERYGDSEILLDKMPDPKKYFSYRNCALGNSHFTMLLSDYMSIGGYDERFIGHGLEDLDFNLRAWRYLKIGVLRPEPQFTIFHLAHKDLKGWHRESLRENNRQIYRTNKKEGIIVVPKNQKWGEFKV